MIDIIQEFQLMSKANKIVSILKQFDFTFSRIK